MWRDKLTQRFWTSDRQQVTAWQGGYRVPLHYQSQRRVHPVFAKIRPQRRSLGLREQSLPTQANIKSAEADFVRVAATLVVRCFDTIGMLPQRRGTLSLLGMVLVVAIFSANKAPAFAATLTDSRLEPTNSYLQITWHQETTPRHLRLAEPLRLVVDLPNTQLAGVKTQAIDSYSRYQARVSPLQKGVTQIVFERSPEVVLSSPKQVSLQRVRPIEAKNSWRLHPLIVQMPTTDGPASPDILPPANLPLNPGGMVKVPPVNRPEAILPSTATPMTSPTVFPRNQIPTLNVPTLESPSAQTPIPLTTSKPLEGSFRRVSPAISPVPVIEFGQPLPKIIRGKRTGA